MIFDHRTYTIHPGKMNDFLEARWTSDNLIKSYTFGSSLI